MLVSLNELSGSTIKALDGEIGQVQDIYFDDRSWIIRFLVVNTHPWLPLSQKVLISPIGLFEFSDDNFILKVSITKEDVKNCPKVEEHQTVSREFEKAYSDYFGYGYYWTGEDAWGEYANPTELFNLQIQPIDKVDDDKIEKNNHLRSANEIEHYGIHALDGKQGHIKDFIWDTYNWSLRYLVIDTRDWLPGGKKVLISPDQLDTLNWGQQIVTCHLNLAQIKACPEYHSDKLNDSKYLEEVKQKLQLNK